MKLVPFGKDATEWHPVSMPRRDMSVYGTLLDQIRDVLVWCAELDTDGRFAVYPELDLFYIERDEDFELFILRWGSSF